MTFEIDGDVIILRIPVPELYRGTFASLTVPQQKVLQLMGLGLTQKEIAAQEGTVSVSAIKNRRYEVTKRFRKKLRGETRSQFK